MRQQNCDATWCRYKKPSRGGKIVATVCIMMALGLLCGKDAAAFLSPASDGLSQQLMVIPGSSSAVTVNARFPAPSCFPRPGAIKGAHAGVPMTPFFWAFVLFAGACSVRKSTISRSASQKLRSCTVACQAVDLPTPVVFQPRASVVEELKSTPAAIAPLPLPVQVTEHRTVACRATMVGGARCRPAARSAARRARQQKTADRTATSRAARRSVGSRLQTTSCRHDVLPLTYDPSRQRLKIQAALRPADQARCGRMHEIRLSAGNAEKLIGLLSADFYTIEDHTDSKNLTSETVRVVACDFATSWPAPQYFLTTPMGW